MFPLVFQLFGYTHLGVVRVRRVVRILRLLCNQCWVELLVAVNVARIDVLGRLAIRSLQYIQSFTIKSIYIYDGLVAVLGLTASVEKQ